MERGVKNKIRRSQAANSPVEFMEVAEMTRRVRPDSGRQKDQRAATREMLALVSRIERRKAEIIEEQRRRA